MLEISKSTENIGTTFSSVNPNIYKQFQKDRDGEVFEKVVFDLTLNKYSDDPELSDYILSLPIDKQRIALLSLIDGDNVLWSKMNSYINECSNKFEHIKDVIKIMAKFVKDGEIEKKKFGEVMTPISLVREMLDTLPKEVWSNPDLKWLDPANGAGTFPYVVIYKLMNGLSEWQPDVELRYKHIVENMIYTCELQSRNVFLWLCGVDPKDEYTTNSYWGSFLDEGFDYHMKEVWGVDKFDVVVGNPPYQETSNSDVKSSDQGRVKLWMKFVNKSLELSNNTLFITPNNWLSKTCYLNDIFRVKLVSSEIDSNYLGQKYFKGVGSTFCYYLLSNNKSSEYIEITSAGKKVNFNIIDMSLFPTKDLTTQSISIFNKVQNKKIESLNFIRERYNLLTSLEFCISIDRSKNKGFVKSDSDIYNTSSYWYICSNQDELEILLNNLNTKLYKFLIKNIRSGMAIVSTINSLPIIKDKIYLDDDLYQLFDLSDNEINFIKKTII